MPIRLKPKAKMHEQMPKFIKNFQVYCALGMRNIQDHVAGRNKNKKISITRDRKPAILKTPYHKRSCSGNQMNCVVSPKETRNRKPNKIKKKKMGLNF